MLKKSRGGSRFHGSPRYSQNSCFARRGDFHWVFFDATNDNFESLQPQIVWAHFATLCAIPRPSLHEAALIEHLISWAQARASSPSSMMRAT